VSMKYTPTTGGAAIDWSLVRGEFDLDPAYVHLAAFWISSHPRPVREAIDFHRRQLDRNPYRYVIENEDRLERDSVSAISSLIGARSGEIVLTHSTTEGLSILYGGLQLTSGDRILTTFHDHYSTATSIRLLAERTGATIDTVSLYVDGELQDIDEIVENVMAGVHDKTRLIALTWVHSSTGVRLPIQDICKRVAAINVVRGDHSRIMVAVDATHAFGAFHFDVNTLGCDFLVAACHKWLYGPRGTAFLWGRMESLERVREVIPSFASGPLRTFMGLTAPGEQIPPNERLRPGGFSCFEHRWAIPAAVSFFAGIGSVAIEQRLVQSATALKVGLSALPSVKLITPLRADLSASIVCFDIARLIPEEVIAFLLARKVIASVSPYKRRYARLTPSIYNTEADVIAACVAIQDLCQGQTE
jgi:isopenicillin-N epimerase